MANQFGYATLFTDIPGTWFTDGYVAMADASGTPVFNMQPSGIVSAIRRNSTGNYSIHLAQPWFALQFVSIVTVVPSGSVAPGIVSQIQVDDVGSAVAPVITFQLFGSDLATPVELPAHGGFRFLLVLKQSSA